jgi:hypothetical protein
MEVFHTEIRDQNSMRVFITLRSECLSHCAACDQNIDLRTGSIPGGVESQICIQKGYYVFYFLDVLRTLEHPGRSGRTRIDLDCIVSYLTHCFD